MVRSLSSQHALLDSRDNPLASIQEDIQDMREPIVPMSQRMSLQTIQRSINQINLMKQSYIGISNAVGNVSHSQSFNKVLDETGLGIKKRMSNTLTLSLSIPRDTSDKRNEEKIGDQLGSGKRSFDKITEECEVKYEYPEHIP